jgi:hypothetical protein
MLSESINTDILFAFIGILALLPVVVSFDRYLIRRHGAAVNAAFIIQMRASRTFFSPHRRLRSARANRNAAPQPKLLPASPTLLMLTSGRG